MLSKHQWELLYDYIKYCRFEAMRKSDEAEQADLDAALRMAIVTEQRRRERELTRLEKAVYTELSAFEKGATPCPDETSAQTAHTRHPKPKSKKKSGHGKTASAGSSPTRNASTSAHAQRGRSNDRQSSDRPRQHSPGKKRS